MIKIHCTGCGSSEEICLEDPKIGVVQITDFIDPRSWTRDATYKAHLCRSCLEHILNTYFGVPIETELEVPDFVDPTIEVEIEPQSLRVINGD